MMRETGFRRQYRQLGPALDPKCMVDKYEPSLASESTAASAQTEGLSDWEDDCKRKTFQTSNEVSSPEELRQSVDEQGRARVRPNQTFASQFEVTQSKPNLLSRNPGQSGR